MYLVDRKDIDTHHVVVFLRVLCRKWCEAFLPLRLRPWEEFERASSKGYGPCQAEA